MPNRDFEIEMKLKADFKSAQQALGETQDGIEAVTDAAGRANTALDKSSNTQANRLREMVQRSIAELDAARAHLEDISGTGSGASTGQAAAVRDLTTAQQAQLQAMRASQQAVSAEIGLIGELQDRLARGASSMDDLADTEARLDTVMSKGLITADEYDEALAKITKEQGKLDAAAAKTDKTLTSTVGRYDKASVGLERLARDEAALKQAVDRGRISREQYNRAMAAIGTERTRLTQLREGAEQSANAMSKLSLRTAESQRNLAQLVQYSATGQWQMAGRQILQLGSSAGATGALFSAAGIAVGGFTALVVTGLLAWKQGRDELFNFQKGLILSGRQADISSAQFQKLVAQIDDLAGVSRGQAVEALDAVSASGELAGQNIQGLAASAARMEASTGKAISSTVAAFESIAKSPVDALLKLDQAEGFLDRAQIARIITLQQEGREQQAVSEALVLYGSHLDDVARRTDAVMPGMYRWWRDLKDEVSGAWGEVVVLAGHIDDLAVRAAQKLPRVGALVGAAIHAALPSTQLGQLNSLFGGNDLPTPIFDPGEDARKDVADYAKVLQESKDAEKSASDALNSRIAGLDKAAAKQAAYNKIVETYNALAEDDPRHFDGSMDRLVAQSNKQIDEQFKAKKTPKTDGQKVDDAAKRELDNLQKQVALLGDLEEGETKASEASRIRYEIEQGAYAKASPALKQQLVDQAQLLDSERALREEQKKKDDAFKETKRAYDQLLDSLRTPSEVALDTAIAQVKTLNEAIKAGVTLSADYTDSIRRIGEGAIGKTPDFQGLAPEVGGAYSELTRIQQAQKDLEAWNQEKLDLIAKGREQEGADQAVWDAADLDRAKKHQDALNQIEQAKGSARLSMASDFFGQIAQLQNSENAKAARIGKAAAIAQAIINTYKAATEAYAAMAGIPYVGPALGVAAAAAAVAAGMAQVSAIRSTATGYATGGRITGPGTGTSDSVLMWGSNGEFMTREAVVSQPGALPFLEDFNKRGMPALYDWTSQARYAEGGLVGAPSLTEPNWQDMRRRQDAATQPAKVDFHHRGVTVFDIDDIAQRLGDSREFEKVTVTTAVNNGKKIRGGWGE